MKKWIKRHTILAPVLGALMLAGTAVAAWVVYTSVVSGSGGTGTFAAPTSIASLTISDPGGAGTSVLPCTGGAADGTCTNGTMGSANYEITNAQNQTETWNSPTVTVTATPDGVTCASHIHLKGSTFSGQTNIPIIASATNLTLPITATANQVITNGSLQFVADSGTPVSCASDVLHFSYGGTSTP
jgi:hypothetical protein